MSDNRRNHQLPSLIANALAHEFRQNAKFNEIHQFEIEGIRIRVTVEFDTKEGEWSEAWKANVTPILEPVMG